MYFLEVPNIIACVFHVIVFSKKDADWIIHFLIIECKQVIVDERKRNSKTNATKQNFSIK